MNLSKKEIIERLCKLSSDVGEYYAQKYAHDCFCSDTDFNFQFDNIILEFIEDKIADAIGK